MKREPDSERRLMLGLLTTIPFANKSVASDASAPSAGAHAIHFEKAGSWAGLTASDRSILAASVPAGVGQVAHLAEAGREGFFIWQRGNYARSVANDALQGLYVKSDIIAPAEGCWVRLWDGITGRPEWFGAKSNDAGIDCLRSIQASLDLCAATQLGSGDYFVSGTLTITKNGSALLGAAHTQTDQNNNDAHCTRIICTSATATIIRIGSSALTDPRHSNGDLTEAVVLQGFTVDRSVNPFTPASGLLGCVGIDVRWCVNCHFERVFSLNSCLGWTFYGTVQHYQRFCSALREKKGSNPANDPFIGFYVNQVYAGSGSSPYNGANASLRLFYCRCFATTEDGTPSLTYSAGVYFAGGWVDTDVIGFETGSGIQYGVYGQADGYGAASYLAENLKINGGNFDPGSIACIWLQDAGSRSAVIISDNYFATTGTAVHLQDFHGTVVITGNQFITSKLAWTGVSAVNTAQLRSENNIFTGYQVAHDHTSLSNFTIRDTINNSYGVSPSPAINLNGCSRGSVDCIINGAPSAYTVGVNLNGSANTYIQVNCTTLNSAAIVRGHKLVYNGKPIAAAGPFGSNCLATGIMA